MRDLLDPAVLDEVAEDVADFITERDIDTWAQDHRGGALPSQSARAFATWLDENFNEFTVDECTVREALEGAVADWCGGRVMQS